jgi:hypothetical protein
VIGFFNKNFYLLNKIIRVMGASGWEDNNDPKKIK